MNSTCRSIDLATNIIAPIAVGQVMYFLSHLIAAVVIATWNIISFFLEYILLWKIYLEFPKLAIKKTKQKKQRAIQETEETVQESTPIKNDGTDNSYCEAQNQSKNSTNSNTPGYRVVHIINQKLLFLNQGPN